MSDVKVTGNAAQVCYLQVKVKLLLLYSVFIDKRWYEKVQTWKLPVLLSYFMRLFLSRTLDAVCTRSSLRRSSRGSELRSSWETPYSVGFRSIRTYR